MEEKQTRVSDTREIRYYCSAKGCAAEAEYFLKLTITSLAGWFCNKCADELIELGILEVIEAV